MPNECGGRTLRLERLVQENVSEIQRLNFVITELQTRVTGDNTRLNALASVLPKRVHRCEDRQAYHIEFLNGFAKNAQEQIATIQYRLNGLEQAQANIPSFGGGPQAQTQHRTHFFDIGSPISDPFTNRHSVPPTGVRQSPEVPTFDPWA